MKNNTRMLIGMLAIGVLVGIVIYGQETTVVYENNEQPANETEVVETPAWMQDADAVKAAEAVVKRKELEAERAELVSEREAIEAETKAKVDAIKARITEIDKETQAYWAVKENLITEIRKTFPEAPNTAVLVAECESGLRMQQSKNTLSYGREQSFGIFQIHAKDWEQTAIKLGLPDYKTDVEQNLAMARHVYEVQGWDAWTCYWHPDYLAMR